MVDKQAILERRRQKWANQSPKEKERIKQYNKERYAKFIASLSPEQLAAYKEKTRKKWEAYSEKLSPEKKTQMRQKIRENNRKRYAELQPQEKIQVLENMRKYHRNLTPKQVLSERERTRQIRQKQKLLALSHYSNNKVQCKICGFSDIRALSIDHINGGGRKHTRPNNSKTVRLYDWLIQNNFPEGYQVLCMNHQFIKKAEKQEDNPWNRRPLPCIHSKSD